MEEYAQPTLKEMAAHIRLHINKNGVPMKNYTEKLARSITSLAINHLSPRLWNTGFVSSRASLTSWGEGASLALVGNPSSDGVTIKMPYPPRLEILGWCPAGTFLPYGEKVPL